MWAPFFPRTWPTKATEALVGVNSISSGFPTVPMASVRARLPSLHRVSGRPREKGLKPCRFCLKKTSSRVCSHVLNPGPMALCSLSGGAIPTYLTTFQRPRHFLAYRLRLVLHESPHRRPCLCSGAPGVSLRPPRPRGTIGESETGPGLDRRPDQVRSI